jgi:hypothetical protein
LLTAPSASGMFICSRCLRHDSAEVRATHFGGALIRNGGFDHSPAASDVGYLKAELGVGSLQRL